MKDSKVGAICLSLLAVTGLLAQRASADVLFEQVETATTANFISLDIAKPSGTVENDLLIAIVSNERGITNGPAGWTVIATALEAKRNQSRTTVFYKVAGPSEPTLYTFTSTDNRKASGAILRYSGHDPSNPIDSSAFATGNSINPTTPDVTTTVDNTRVVRFFGARKGPNLTDPYPAGTTGRFAIDVAGKASSGAADAAQASAGVTGTANFLLTAADGWVAVTVAITPAGCLIDPDCDDADICTDDVCNAGSCEYTNNAVACDDGDACTTTDTCSAGVCVGGTPPNCDDGDVCTDDSCDVALGCQSTNNTVPCDDADACTTGDTCSLGVCVGGAPPNCDDGDVCTDDSCDIALGCQNTDNTAACDDGNACTTADTCSLGVCVGGAPPNCDDSDVCTDDSCDIALGCQNTNNTAVCDDGDACTTSDTCSLGVCVGGAPPSCDDGNVCTDDTCDVALGCQNTNNVAACDDGNACTTTDTCSVGVCVGGAPPNCDDGNLCTDDSCDIALGCQNINNAAVCDDGNACTTGDTCAAGACVGGAPPNCNDGNLCTTDSCDIALGCQNTNNTSACDDGDACTTADTCSGGVCVGGAPPSCDDGNVCTDDSCDIALGCQNTNNVAVCDDGSACTTADTCSGGVCVGGAPPNCDDGNVCTSDSCDIALGCQNIDNTGACDDGDVCTTSDTCSLGVCVGGAPPSCDDGNVCTDDSCDIALGCQNVNNTAACDDGNACTVGDVCSVGVCVIGSPPNCDDGNICTDDSCDIALGCQNINNTVACDDGSVCTTTDTCSGGVCVGSAPLNCDDGNVCTDDSCDVALGCQNTNNSAPCDDGNACTTADTCSGGACVGGAPPSCDDGNVCTDDSCDVALGCQNTNNAVGCDDGSACTSGDACSAGICAGTPIPDCIECGLPSECDDADVCTDDDCVGGVCVFTNNAAACDDGNACTTGDTCSVGVCVGGAPPNCNDGNVCTDDSCDIALGCQNTNNTAACDDGSACTTSDTCSAGVCVGGAPPNCDDGNVCTDDSCDIALGCQNANNVAACDDGNACTTSDTCSAGVCVGGAPPSCDDGNVCTDDSCDVVLGCQNVNNAAACNDSNACTTSDTCSAGVCVGGAPPNCDDGNLCTDDSCDIALGCQNINNTVACDDGDACTAGDACALGACVGGAPPNCDDGNVCTDDSCDIALGCQNINNTVACDDGDACTTSDTCSLGVCVGGAPPNCDDGNLCTDDSCDIALGCQNANNVAACDDGNACTTSDTCSVGACVGGAPPNCDDGNVCTDDSCDIGLGCQNVNNTTACDDGDACTTGDTCSVGVCVGGAPPNCDDGNICTDDSCDIALGCQNVNNVAACDDGDACTTSDACSGGVCVGGAAPNCDDGNVCTDDSCDIALGCQNVNNVAACDDGNACTTSDTCSLGVCVGGAPPNCDDGNACTDDSCDVALGCQNVNNTVACDDGNACTTADICTGGACVGGVAPDCDDGDVCTDDSCDTLLGCQNTNNTAPCDDGNACTTADTCAAGVCVGGAAPNCNDGNVCTDDSCDIVLGCQNSNNTSPCDDGDACTTSDTCSLGVCVGGAPPSCDDGNVCTDDSCDIVLGCQNANNVAACDDGSACTNGDVCNGGICTGTPIPDCTECSLPSECNDSNVCTLDGCVGGVCVFANSTSPCDDGNACTTSDTCAGGVCVGGAAPNCDDGNVCTDDSCDIALGCQNTNNSAACDDGDACTTTDTCSLGVCVGGVPPNCDDGNVCTDDSCDIALGCQYSNNTLACDDGNACTTADTCVGGACVGGAAPNCDDGNVCTDDSCDIALGCQNTNNIVACDDGDACTTSDTCLLGVCVGGAPPNCDDGNVCTDDSCDIALGCQNTNNTTACDDGNACTTSDTCSAGVCVGGAPPNCDDGNVCTDDSCDISLGCQYTNNAASCDDGDACTTGDTCSASVCVGGAPPNCDDGNICTDDSCDGLLGCQNVDNTIACDDGNACTTGDTCSTGVCVGGAAPNCDDGNVCTDDSCDVGLGCQNIDNTAACDDADACTTADTCSAGVCVGGAPPNCNDGNVCTDDSCDISLGCQNIDNVAACDDGNACTTSDTCSTGICVGGAPPNCDDGNICTDDSCDTVLGCQNINNTVACDDGNACTTSDTCSTGICVGGAPPNCDDGNICTDDSCDIALGCQNNDNTAPCDDGNACTTSDTCSAGICVGGAPPNCDDGNVCTDDSCDIALGCQNTANTAACDDGDACTTADACSGGACVGGPPPSCDDSNVCTDDTCDALLGCQNTNNVAACEDGNACTTSDTCSAGVCIGGAPPNCDDGNVCTDDSCDIALGCQNLANTTPCDDGDACTTSDTCSVGTCVGGPPPNCDDGNVCTDDFCDIALGCQNIDNVAVCDDGDACTTSDTCSLGLCVGGASPNCDDGNVCTDDSCDVLLGCLNISNTVPCDDGNACTTSDTCSVGVCVGGAAPNCDDGDVCTDDSCDIALGCQNTDNVAACDDGNACTTADTCSLGVCVGGAPPDCDDGDVCTDDSCDTLSGCQNINNVAACDDGDACTTGDTCSLGVCAGGVPPDCDDGNVCTDDSCDIVLGCQNVNNTIACDDGNACTTSDTCASGVCVGGAPPSCDDGNVCTDDSCDIALGCQSTNNIAACDDGNACTTSDTCSLGICVSGAPLNCDDGNVCTDDSCDIALGCQNINNTVPCDDGSVCTTVDTCSAGACVGSAPLNCDDGDVCTDDTCDALLGCQNTDNTALCDDGNACTTGDTCSLGVCVGGAPPDCDDGNVCTADSCDVFLGCKNDNISVSCDDGNACTTGDTCSSGVCVGGPPPNCNDGNVCTDDSCDTLLGCQNVNNTTACDDGNACTTADTCSLGVCVGGAAPNCDDGNVCTDDSCDTLLGCQNVNNIIACDDGNACTTSDTCSTGVCVGGSAPNCDDGNICTDDSCDITLGCQNISNTVFCDDGNACTTSDTCSLGVCVGGASLNCDDGNVCTDDSCDTVLGCQYANNISVCDDGNACTTSDTCSAGTCVGGPPPNCDDGNVCTADSCDTFLGCQNDNVSIACDDGNACTTSDTCSAGVCVGGAPPNCDDGNVCTDDSCDVLLGCQNANNTVACDDGDACTTADTCSVGVCVGGVPPNCDDGNVCTDDSCDSVLGCQSTNNIAACDDGNACTTSDTCAAGICVGGAAPDCSDGNICTDDSCDIALGCQSINNVAVCDDGNACTTGDACSGGACAGGAPPNCDDGNVCTDDSCDVALGCQNTSNTAVCDDGNACTTSDTCSSGTCTGGAAPNCDDSNVCTDDSCDFVLGCQNTNNTAPCDDGSACTDADVCASGTCTGTPVGGCTECTLASECDDANPCTDNDCVSNVCVFTNNAVTCDDGNACTTSDTCSGGVCVGGAAPNCDDGNICTDDSCDLLLGCQNINNTAPCDDGNACTTPDTCLAGVCVAGPPPNCDDGDVCTDDSCDIVLGCQNVNNTASCDDENACTTADTCSLGVCVGGAPPNCDDGNICTSDTCHIVLGCQNTANTAPCDDGDACTTGDTCSAGVCVGGASPNCDDGNVCTIDSCDIALGCQNDPNTAACDDGNACTTGDTCSLGVCVGGAPPNCDDGNVCTTDTCDLALGCQSTNNTAPCDDGNACTTADTCSIGACVGGPPPNCDDANVCTNDSCDVALGCQNTNNIAACDDGNACTTADTCASGVCVGGAAPNCDDGNVCTSDSCDAVLGCQNTNNTASCDDGNACTTADTCAGGACVGGAAPNCSDGNVCTDDSCDTALGCQNTNNTAACNDGNVCTTADTCASGVCVGGAAPDCDDGNPCTDDTCDLALGCIHIDNAASCDDGNACTTSDTCSSGICVGGAPPNCDDGNVCTNDSCDLVLGCQSTDNTAPCDDGDACTTADTCSLGVCSGGPPADCDDGNVCTDDSCDVALGCQNTNNTVSCDDGSACTTGDTCSSGVCVGGAPPNCDDGNVCTDDSCDVALGCQNTDNTASCDDGNACTTTDTCSAGACVGGPAPNCDDGNVCTNDSCDLVLGCQNTVNTAPCDDGNACTEGDTCAAGLCVGGPPPNCDDGNVCTNDTCDLLLGCLNNNNTSPCDDGNACTTGDTCSAGLCVGGAAPNCDDGNVCTDDSCDLLLGCRNIDNTAPCDDANACTTVDTCSGGTCVGGAPLSCVDGNVCTDDSCDPGIGCVNTNNTVPCDDGNACTTGDACSIGVCVGGAPPNCDDGNVCTSDSCDLLLGCQNTDNTAPCDDGNACTTGDTCAAGVCSGGAPPNCDDGNVCTSDSCDLVLGCQNIANTAPCDDGNACTTSDTCGAGVCVGGSPPNCDDGNICTSDSCNLLLGCQNIDNTAPCDDGNACTTADTCSLGVCVGGAPPNCDDANICTSDSCDLLLGCQNINNTAPCDDGNACTTNDACAAGVCTGGAPPNCDDGNVCTDDSCDISLGCRNIDNTAACDDGNACTTADTCSVGVCVGGAPPNCDDGNVCTSDTCDLGLGCQNTNNTAPCDDSNACTTGDTCASGVCVGGAPPNCDDASVCTTDSCDIALGCQNVANTDPCDDGNACTASDTCSSGVCVGGAPPNCDDGNVCTNDTCDLVLGCRNIDNSAGCDDGNACTTADTCSLGVCVGGPAPNCSDGNVCTDDTCDLALGCQNTSNTAPCNDGNACTTSDTCSGGVCVGGVAPNCDDGNVCTNDSCDLALGCRNIDNTAPCSDGNACTTADTCTNGFCVGGPAPNCADGNVCTDDTCDLALGCQNTNNTAACNDANACTTGDTCSAGACVGGVPPNCDDGNVCTDDSCDLLTGCQNIDNFSACDDGNACSTADTCSGGVCVGGAPPDCDDGNVCTDDTCDLALGCLNINNTAPCDDGVFCTGTETCSAGVCVSTGDPCTGGSLCDETSDTCGECLLDADCDDGLYCTGVESCTILGTGNTCASSGDPCPPSVCEESSDSCLPPPTIKALELFYAGRYSNAADPNAVFLASGATSTTANATYYVRGITGIRVTFDTIVTFATVPSAAFSFDWTTGSDTLFSAVTNAATAISVTATPVAGETVVEIVINDDHVRRRWLRVTIDAAQVTANGVALDGELFGSPVTTPSGDLVPGGNAVFYIANQPGDADGDGRTLLTDVGSVRSNANPFASVPITNRFDVDKDGRVLLTDVGETRLNANPFFSLPVISP